MARAVETSVTLARLHLAESGEMVGVNPAQVVTVTQER
jgi:hypothetical protein